MIGKLGIPMYAMSPNRAYLASVLRTSAQIQPDGWISDTLGTLSEIPNPLNDNQKYFFHFVFNIRYSKRY